MLLNIKRVFFRRQKSISNEDRPQESRINGINGINSEATIFNKIIEHKYDIDI